jgi:hypothetical protein
MTPLATAQAPIATARGCLYLDDGHCSAVMFTAEKADAVSCSLQLGTYQDCPIYKTAPRG